MQKLSPTAPQPSSRRAFWRSSSSSSSVLSSRSGGSSLSELSQSSNRPARQDTKPRSKSFTRESMSKLRSSFRLQKKKDNVAVASKNANSQFNTKPPSKSFSWESMSKLSSSFRLQKKKDNVAVAPTDANSQFFTDLIAVLGIDDDEYDEEVEE